MNTKEKLQLILETFKQQVTPAEFNFNTYVEKNANGCGTICCIVGWFPKLFPKAGIRWAQIEGMFTLECATGLTVKDHLSVVLQCPLPLVEYLFYGTRHFSAPLLGPSTTYEEIIKAWEWAIENYKFVDTIYKLE